jgi:hypothetical protein
MVDFDQQLLSRPVNTGLTQPSKVEFGQRYGRPSGNDRTVEQVGIEVEVLLFNVEQGLSVEVYEVNGELRFDLFLPQRSEVLVRSDLAGLDLKGSDDFESFGKGDESTEDEGISGEVEIDESVLLALLLLPVLERVLV